MDHWGEDYGPTKEVVLELLDVADAAARVPHWHTIFDLMGKVDALKKAIAPLLEEIE
jgi:hypothetical protein